MERTTAANFIRVVSIVAMIAVGWQAVRFIMGDFGNLIVVPISEFFLKISEAAGLSSEALDNRYLSYMRWCCALAAWVIAALMVGGLGKIAERKVLVGWKQSRAEILRVANLTRLK
ncbi:TPA: hypothetical protein ACIRVE_005087 [Pseudomonas putida]